MAGLQHGGALDRAIAEFGGEKADWLDLSTGINPNPYPVPDMPTDIWHRLPDEGLFEDCLAAARAYYNVPDHMDIVAAPGTQPLIQLMPKILKAETVSIVSPTYGEHAHCWAQAGAEVSSVSAIGEAEGKTLIVVNPNNPDGKAYLPETLRRHFGRLIVDEAFCDVSPECSFVQGMGDNAIVLKSFGKFFGLAGLRLGFAIASKEFTSLIRDDIGPWAVSGPALYIGARAMRDRLWIEGARLELKVKRESLEKMIQKAGMQIVGCTELFVTVSHSDSEYIAKSLAAQHILVRSFDYAPTWIRFGIPKDDAAFAQLEHALTHATKSV